MERPSVHRRPGVPWRGRRAFVSGGITYVDGDVNGDKVVDLHIALTNHPTLVAGDFVL